MDLNIIKIASDTSNNKVIKHYTDIAKQKNPLCGDHIEIKLNLNNVDQTISNFYDYWKNKYNIFTSPERDQFNRDYFLNHKLFLFAGLKHRQTPKDAFS